MTMALNDVLSALSPDQLLSANVADEIANVEWPATLSPCDWRANIPEGLKAIWQDLSAETRVVAYVMANGLAECSSVALDLDTLL